MLRELALLISLLTLCDFTVTNANENEQVSYDLVVYGATPAGIASAVALGRRDPDSRILLVTPFKRVGGMITNGLTHPDFRTFEARTGLFREFNRRVEESFRVNYGAESQQVKDSLLGTHAGPEVNHQVFEDMLDLPSIQILTEHRLVSVTMVDQRIKAVTLVKERDAETIGGEYFVDATYEGDLLAAAGVDFRVGREGRREHDESLAPETEDDQVQGYNFRLTMTDVAENRAEVPRPVGYDRRDYLPLLPLLADGTVPRIFGDPYAGLGGGIYKRQTPKLPNGKRDINDVSRAAVRLSLPNINNDWPEGDFERRREIFDLHLRHNVGMLYFLQNDPDVPQQISMEARQWGLCRDELKFNGHLPEQLYVREARRMVGRYVFTQKDVERAKGSHHARAIFHADAIAMGDYGPNCHGTFHEGPLYGGRHTGEFYQPAAPYQIPYGTLLPKNVNNLAVPVACSASHVGFCALRLEPIWMSLGQASGEAVGLALQTNSDLAQLSPLEVADRLHLSGGATIYTSDVPEESDDFAAVQWWGSRGGFVAIDRTLADEPADYGRRGKQVIGQYCEAFPKHEVGLNHPLSERVRGEWIKLAERLGIDTLPLRSVKTRGDFIRAVWRTH